MPGNDKVKRVGALLEFETIKSATGVLVSTVAAGMTFNAAGFTLAMIQTKVPRWEISMEQELRFGQDLGQMANFPAFIASKSFDL